MFSPFDLKIPSLGDVLNNFNINAKAIFGQYDLIDHDTQKTICSFTSFAGWARSQSSSVPSQAIEEGSFAAYNKVNTPNSFTVSLIKTGLPYELKAYADDIKKYAESTKLIDIVLPIGTFLGYNIVSVSDGIAEGDAVNLLAVELNLREIKEQRPVYQTKSLPADKLKYPSDSSVVQMGRKQPSELVRLFR